MYNCDNINVERVQRFQYLGAMFTTNGDGASNIKQRLAMAVQALNNMQYLWKSASKELKLKVMRTCIFPIATYGHRRTGRGVRGGSCPPPQFGQFVDMNSGRESRLFGQSTIHV